MNSKVLIFLTIVVIGVLAFWYFGIKEKQDQKTLVDNTPDQPIPFGYKSQWLAIKTTNQQRIAEMLDLNILQACNWSTGLESTYKLDEATVFITPAIDGWVLATGWGLPYGAAEATDYKQITKLLNELSSEFGEAQYFATHRVTEYHCWMKSINGEIIRQYGYLGESMENTIISGEPTEVEQQYNLINLFSEEANSEDYLDRDDVTWPDEETVMEIAAAWSIAPNALDNRQDVSGLGLCGTVNLITK